MRYFSQGDLATGNFAISSVLVTQPDIGAADVHVPMTPPVASTPVIPDILAPTTTCPSAVPAAIAPTRASIAPVPVRPFVRRVRARPEDPFPALVREILQSQEVFHSRMTKYDKVIKIFQERFMFGLNARQEMGFIALFSESKATVDQFFSFSDAQRDIFVQDKKMIM